MSDPLPLQQSIEPNGNGGDAGAQMDVAMAQRLRAVTREFSHRELGELTGMSHETVRRYLEGRVPGPGFIKRLCEALGLSADWLLLGRGTPVYQREQAVNEISGSIDELFEGLARYLRRLHLELAQAETRLQEARGRAWESASQESAPGSSTGAALVVPAEDFVDPFDPGAAVSPAVAAPHASSANSGPAPVRPQIRLVLGPLNGRQVMTDEPLGAEIRLRLGVDNQVEMVGPDQPDFARAFVYRRVFDRVFRWQSGSRQV